MSSFRGITEPQASNLAARFKDRLRKSGHSQETIQKVSRRQCTWLMSELMKVVEGFVGRMENENIVEVRMPRVLHQMELIGAVCKRSTGQEIDQHVVETMPLATSPTVGLVFFDSPMSAVDDEELSLEYKLRGLRPATPDVLAVYNEANPTFCKEMPNATHWKDRDGKWCCAAFYDYGQGMQVKVERHGLRHVAGWLMFVGVPI